MTRHCTLIIVTIVLGLLSVDNAWAQQPLTPYFRVEGGANTMVSSEYRDTFGFGFHANGRVGLSIVGPLSLQISSSNMWFPVEGEENGTLYTVQFGAKIWFPLERRMLGGPYIDANFGLGITGDIYRFVFDFGFGWDFTLARFFAIGPTVRYLHIVQPNDQEVPEDGSIVVFGLAMTFSVPRGRDEPQEPVDETPPPDADLDRIPDDEDRCPDVPEDVDGFQDDDGCPDEDDDDDGFPDSEDNCPRSAEVRNGFEDDDGCPDEAPEQAPPPPPPPQPADEDFRELPQRVLFQYRSAHVPQRFHATIDEVAEYVRNNPNARLRIVGHADERGSVEYNRALSMARASAVAQRMALQGVPTENIEILGAGTTAAECSSSSEGCYQRNRRVFFMVAE